MDSPNRKSARGKLYVFALPSEQTPPFTRETFVGLDDSLETLNFN